MEPQVAAEPFDSPDHFFEVKWDGFRCLAFVSRHGIRLQGRRLRDLTGQYPEIPPAARKLVPGEAILDGELIAAGAGGKPDFHALLRRQDPGRGRRSGGSERGEVQISYVVFDLLRVDGRMLFSVPWTERRAILDGWFSTVETAGGVPRLVLSRAVPARGKALFEAVELQGMEGIVAKRGDSPYLPGRKTPFWLKVKCRRRIRATVCGLTAGAGGLGALILGLRTGNGWVHVGKVGSGFTDRDRRELADILMRLPGPCPLSPAPRYREKVTWVKPELDCEVEFGEWTPEGKLRAPSFKGLRP